jgi:hypothetical protein
VRCDRVCKCELISLVLILSRDMRSWHALSRCPRNTLYGIR